MFNFFGKEKHSITIRHWICITEEAKLQAILNEYKKNNNIIIAVWFDSTYRKLEAALSNSGFATTNLFIVQELASHYLKNNPIIFAEHYPLRNREENLFEKLNLSEAIIYSSLEEPLLSYFGGEKLSDMVTALGFKGNETLEHKLISSSIKNVQDKIAASVVVDQSANSASDWFLFNLSKNQV